MSDFTPIIVPILSFGAVAAVVFVIGHYYLVQMRMHQRLSAHALVTDPSREPPLEGIHAFIARNFNEKRLGIDPARREKLRGDLLKAGYFGRYGANYYVSFENEAVGKLQAQTLVDTLKAAGKTSGNIAEINGAPTDPNAADFKKGAHSVLDTSGYKIAAEFDTPDWSPDKAQAWMEGQLSAIKNGLVGVYAANDGTAGGAIAALKGGGVKPLPPVTGQDSELAAIQRIVSGDQAMTIYKAVKPQAEAAAKAAVALASGGKADSTSDFKGVPATILDPIAVTKANINDTVVKDGIYKVTDICTASFAAACTAAGLK